MKRIRLLGISAALLLVAGSAGAQTTFFTNGVLRNQMWTSPDQSRLNIENGVAGTPNSDAIGLDIFQYPTTSPNVDNWGQRISGFFIPAVTTNYVFFCASDDDGDLFLSTDSNPANKRLIAQQATWDNFQVWTGSPQKRSDQWTNSAGVAPYTNGFHLVAGQKYWIEYVKHDGGGGDDAGANFKIVGEPDPANATASLLTGDLIGYGLTFGSPVVKTDVKDATTFAGVSATFTFVATISTSDPIAGNPTVYQWYRNGSLLTNATGSSYTIVPTAADSGAQFQAVASLDPQYNLSLSVTSKVGTLTVTTGSLTYTNGLKLERFPGATRQGLEAGNAGAGAADLVTVSINGAEAPVNDGVNNYAHRMSGWYIPPANGNYVFFLSSDDDSDLFLSTDATAANKQLIAQANTWSASREWVLTANGGGLTNADDPGVFMKRSDQWTNGLGVTPFTNGIALLAGHPYYIEADQSQGGGGDNLAILAQLVGQPDPTNGAPPIPANQLSLITKPTTTLTFTNQPHNTTVFEGGTPIFKASATSDSEFAVLYQWQRNGTNIPGATTTSYSLTATVADSGTTFDLVASTAEGGLTTNSTTVTLTVGVAVLEPGLALMEYWTNKTADLTIPESGAFGAPNFVMAVPAFAAGLNNENGNTYVNRVSGFFIPATTGAYDFLVSGDDHIDVFLSTDKNPNNKRLICQQPGWSGALVWDDGATPLPPGTGNPGNNSASDRNQMNSGTWTNASGARPNGNGIQLTQGVKYYLEAWHQEGGGGDSVAVTAIPHGSAIPANGTPSTITGSQLAFNSPTTDATYVEFTNQPVSVSVLSGNTATFTAGGDSDATLEIGTTGIFNTSGDVPNVGKYVKFPNVLFQWYKNGTLIPGATATTYTTPTLKPGDSAQYYMGIRPLGAATWSNSVTASLTVIADTNKPHVFAAEFDNNLVPSVSVSFDKAMDLASISDMSHYTVSGATIAAILVNSNDARHVTLQLTATPTTLPASLTITGITDVSGNTPTVSTVSVPGSELTNLDIGVVGDPAFPGFMWVDGTNAYTIKCEGSDIWNADDGFNFSYETKTGDFDVAVRQMTFTKTSQWSKGGLMVREDLTSGSRNWNIINGPSNADGTPAQDGQGTGQNQVECNARLATGVASNTGWDNIARPAVTYPNAWVRLKRVGNTLTAFSSSDGVQWRTNAYTDWSTNAVPMPATVYVGICGASHFNDAPTADPPLHYYTASFDSYNSSFVPSTVTQPHTISVGKSGSTVTITYTGTLFSSSTANGTYTAVAGATSPYTVPSTTGAAFYRAH